MKVILIKSNIMFYHDMKKTRHSGNKLHSCFYQFFMFFFIKKYAIGSEINLIVIHSNPSKKHSETVHLREEKIILIFLS